MDEHCGKCPNFFSCDKRMRGENEACPGAVSKIPEPSAVDHNFKPLYMVRVTEDQQKGDVDQ